MPGESKGCGCCCASRICFMVYCGIFALLSLIGIVNFVIPSANTCCSGLTFFLTGEAPSVEAAAYRYCNEFAIENGSSPTALGYTCDDVCMCGGEMCDFTAQAQQHFLGYIIQFGTNLVWIVVLIIGIIVACCKSASGVLCVMIVSTVLFVVQIDDSAFADWIAVRDIVRQAQCCGQVLFGPFIPAGDDWFVVFDLAVCATILTAEFSHGEHWWGLLQDQCLDLYIKVHEIDRCTVSHLY